MSLKHSFVSVFLTLILISGCASKNFYKQSRLCLGTKIDITIPVSDKSRSDIKSAVDKAFSKIEKVDSLMSIYNKDSEISKINSLAAGESIRLSKETFEVLSKAKQFSRITNGAFDVTVGSVMGLYDFVPGKIKIFPTKEIVLDKLKLVGYDKVVLNKRDMSVSLGLEGVKIDLGAIAKGFAVDKAVEALKENGINACLVNAGGDIYCLGKRSPDHSWRVGVQHPRSKDLLGELDLQDKAVATSGDYRKFFHYAGERFSHIIDPKTGFPIKSSIVSVTVTADSCMQADALATAIFVIGDEKGIKLIDKENGVEALIVSQKEGKLRIRKSRNFDVDLKGMEE